VEQIASFFHGPQAVASLKDCLKPMGSNGFPFSALATVRPHYKGIPTMTTPRKRGRPPKPEGRQPPGRHVAVPPELFDRLAQIAERERLYHGPAPSITGAIRWLVSQDQADALPRQ
jgi:hypothetical protein